MEGPAALKRRRLCTMRDFYVVNDTREDGVLLCRYVGIVSGGALTPDPRCRYLEGGHPPIMYSMQRTVSSIMAWVVQRTQEGVDQAKNDTSPPTTYADKSE